GELYVATAFPEAAKSRAADMVADVRAALGARIRSLDWMSAPTRDAAEQKLARMDVKIGYPEHFRDYSALDLGTGVFADHWLAANRFEFARNRAKLGRLADRTEWFMSPHIVNAYY